MKKTVLWVAMVILISVLSGSVTNAAWNSKSNITDVPTKQTNVVENTTSDATSKSNVTLISDNSKQNTELKITKMTNHKPKVKLESFYVATNGSDRNDGSMAHPWATVQHAVNVVPNGAMIYLLSGIYHQRVLIEGKGNSNNIGMTIENAPNAHAVLEGTGLAAHDGGLITIKNSRGITIKGLEIRKYSTNSSTVTPMGVEITGHDTNIQLIGNHIHDISTTVDSADGNALGIGIYGTDNRPITGLKIVGNEVDHLRLGSSESITLNGNVNGFSVINNLVHDNNNIGIDAIGFEGTAPLPELDRARNGLISGNTVYHISSYGNPAYGNQYAADGLYIDGGTNIEITQNQVYNNDFGVELASEHHNGNTSHITMMHNWIYNNRDAGLAMGGYDKHRGFTSDCVISHNTFYNNDSLNTGDGQVYFAYEVHDVKVTNNLIYGRANDVLIGNPFLQNWNNNLNHNDYYSPDGVSNVQFQWKLKTWTGFSDYQKGTKNDGSSVFAKPMFTNPLYGNLHQTERSRAYGA